MYSGPPEVHYHDQREPFQSLDSQEEDEPYPQVPHGYENGEVSGSDSERKDEEVEEEEEEEAPPIPPRGKSLSPETKPGVSGMNAAREELLNGRMMTTATGHFLGPGRGDAVTQSPPLYHGEGEEEETKTKFRHRSQPSCHGNGVRRSTRRL